MSIQWNELPVSLQQYRDKIQTTAKPSIEMALQPTEQLQLWQSKVGGDPYLPLTQSYPQSLDGQNLQLLAQINFAELPENELYPKTGILQFFINPNDDLYGLNFDDQQKQDGFRVIFYDSVTQDLTALHQTFPEIDEDGMSPVSGQYQIQFSADESYIDLNDFEFSKKVTDLYDQEDEDEVDAFSEAYSEAFSGSGHRLGGYPFFTQTDPREYNEEIQDYVLLLQIDTDDVDGHEIMWGDSGVGNFFIHPEDLKKRDFSKVLYNWDCY